MSSCPRCREDRPSGEFYGPCESCLVELRATLWEAPRIIKTEYRPRANVTANHVATKE